MTLFAHSNIHSPSAQACQSKAGTTCKSDGFALHCWPVGRERGWESVGQMRTSRSRPVTTGV